MNLNKLAKAVTLLEGGKKSLSIAQVKEAIRCNKGPSDTCSCFMDGYLRCAVEIGKQVLEAEKKISNLKELLAEAGRGAGCAPQTNS